jgi:hypothetical protein
VEKYVGRNYAGKNAEKEKFGKKGKQENRKTGKFERKKTKQNVKNVKKCKKSGKIWEGKIMKTRGNFVEGDFSIDIKISLLLIFMLGEFYPV